MMEALETSGEKSGDCVSEEIEKCMVVGDKKIKETKHVRKKISLYERQEF